MNKHKVLITGSSIASKYLDLFHKESYKYKVIERAELLSRDELLDEFREVTAYLCGGDERTDESIYKEAHNLRIISFLGVGYQAFMDEDSATRYGIAITNTPGTLKHSVAEATVGLLICLQRKLFHAASSIKEGVHFTDKTYDIHGRRIGVLGLGNIGSEVAKILSSGFGAEVVYHNRTRNSNAPYEYLSLEKLLETSDVIIVMVTGSPQNYGLIGLDQFRTCKPNCMIINTARPEIIDPISLMRALEKGYIAGVAMDGYYGNDNFDIDEDPYGLLKDSSGRVIVTPHIGSLTHDARDKMSEMAINSIIGFLEDRNEKHVVNPYYVNHRRPL